MNTTNEYTDAQIQTAIDAAFPSGFIQNDPYLATFIRDARWPDETPNRLAIARAFLAALPKPKAMTADEGAPATSDPYARLKAYAAAGARIRIDEDSWFTNEQYPWGFKELPEEYEVHPDDLHLCPEYAPKPANTGLEMALGGQMYWRDLALQLADVWWKCYGIGASLQHGDLNKDVAFSIVCEKHGGRVFHADTPHNAWLKAEKWLMSPDRCANESSDQLAPWTLPAEASAEPEKAKGIPLSKAFGLPPGSFHAHLVETQEKERAEEREQQEHIKAGRAKADIEHLEKRILQLTGEISACWMEFNRNFPTTEFDGSLPNAVRWLIRENMLAKIPKEASQAQPEKAKTEKAGVNLEEALEKLEANLESWEEKADAMLDSERWHMKPRTEALVTELEEARAKIAEMEGKQAKPAEASAEPEKAQSSEIAGLCSDCGEAVTHRPGKPGEFDHECKAKPADDGPPWIPHDGGPCPLKDEEVEEWEYKMRSGEVKRDMPDERPSYRRWTHENFSTDIIAFRVLRWKPGHGPQAASKADEPARAETFEAVKRERDDLRFVMERQKPWNAKAQEMLDGGRWAGHTYMEGLITELEEARARLAEYAKAESVEPWTPAPGDVVRLKSGGPSMTVGDFTPEGGVICDWFNEGECEARVFPAACLTPAKEDKDDSKVFKPVDDVIWRNP